MKAIPRKTLKGSTSKGQQRVVMSDERGERREERGARSGGIGKVQDADHGTRMAVASSRIRKGTKCAFHLAVCKRRRVRYSRSMVRHY